MLFDRFSFRERESNMSEEDAMMADLPTESRSYSFTLDTRQMVFLIAGYCFLCVLVFALGMVVGRATSQPETVAETASPTTSQALEQPPKGQPDLSADGRIPLLPPTEPKKQPAQTPEFAFSPTLPEAPAASRAEIPSAAAPSRSKSTPMPEATFSSEPPGVTPTAEEKHESERRRPTATADSKPKAPPVARAVLSQGGDYTIQVSSFRSMDQASELKGRLSKKGYAAYVQSVELSDKGTWHRVRVGNYRDKDGAERVAGGLRSQESLPATVMKR